MKPTDLPMLHVNLDDLRARTDDCTPEQWRRAQEALQRLHSGPSSMPKRVRRAKRALAGR